MSLSIVEAVPGDLAGRLHFWLTRIRAQPTSACPVRTRSGAVLMVVARASEVREALLHPALVVRESISDSGTSGKDGNLIALGPEVHARRRGATAGVLSKAGLAPYSGTLQRLADSHASALGTGLEVELLRDFCQPFVAATIAEIFGLPIGVPELQTALSVIFDRSPGQGDRRARARATEVVIAAVTAAVDAHLTGSAPGDSDLVSRFVHRPIADAGGRSGLISLVATLVLGGFGSTVQAIALTVHTLVGADAGRDHWHSAADPARAGHLLTEVLRLDSPGPFASPRTALRDVVIGRSRIPAGATVLIALAGADRDIVSFADADQFRPDRTEGTLRHTFGIGAHRCPGAVLARLEVVAAITALACMFPMLTTTDKAARWRGSLTSRGLTQLSVIPGPPSRRTTEQPRERRGSARCDR